MVKLLLSSLLLLFNYGYSDCNYGFFLFFPFIDGECQTCSDGDCDDLFSGAYGYKVTCIDSSNANLTAYSDTSCSTVASMSQLSSTEFSCGNSGSCSSLDVDFADYDENDCSGNKKFDASVTVAKGDFCYLSTSFNLYVGVEIEDDLVKFELYVDSSCTTSAGAFDGNATEGCTNDGDGNSTKVVFSSAPQTNKISNIAFITGITFAALSFFY